MRVLAISGSLRSGSLNGAVLREAARLAPEGVEVVVWDGLRDIPPFDEDADAEGAPEVVRRMREEIAAADALLIATPEYNSSIPGQLKNALDWASRPYPDNSLRGLPAVVVSASTGQHGALWAQQEVRKVLGASGARVLEPGLMLARAATAFDPEGRLVSAMQTERLVQCVRALEAEGLLAAPVAA